MANLGGTGVGFGGSGGMGMRSGSGGATSSSSEHPSTGINQQYLILGNPFQDPDLELLESMRRQWQQLPNLKVATVEGLTWEGTAEENARIYVDLVGGRP